MCLCTYVNKVSCIPAHEKKLDLSLLLKVKVHDNDNTKHNNFYTTHFFPNFYYLR